MTVRRLVAGLVVACGLTLTAGCSDSTPPEETAGTPSASTPESPSATPSTAPETTVARKPMTKPTKAWPTPKVTGAPAEDAALAKRIRFSIAKQAQLAAGKTAATTVSCPGLDTVETQGGKHTITCTVTYAGKPYDGKLTVDASTYKATYRFVAGSVPTTRAKVVDAVVRVATNPAAVSCAMDEVAIVKDTDANGIRCEVTPVAGAAQSYRAQVNGVGTVTVVKA